MAKVSILIPAREEPFLARTVEHLLQQARGDIEILVILDGWQAEVPADPRVKVLTSPAPYGLRPALNAAADLATGDYLLKIDAHCAVSQGFDVELARQCEADWLVVPAKFSLYVETWSPFKAPWFYFYLTFPYDPGLKHIGLHEKDWPARNLLGAHLRIDDILSFQGSCWFLPTAYFRRLGPMDPDRYYIAQEAVELGLKVWLSGGRVVINKSVWYAHLHKGRAYRRGFARHKGRWEQAMRASAEYWLGNQWPARTHDFRWVVEKFWPLPGWPTDWEDPRYRKEALARG